MLPPLVPLTSTTRALLLSEATLIDQPAAIAVVDGSVTVRLDVGVLKLEITNPQSLAPAAKLLTEAAELTTNKTLKDFLSKRAEAFRSDNYYASDVAWMDLDAPIELTIGPYETYEDELFGYKAAFEAFVTLRDEAESAKLV